MSFMKRFQFVGTSQESFHRQSAVVIVLDRFEHFCAMARQTLLYNLFNLAQDLSIFGSKSGSVSIHVRFEDAKNSKNRT